MPNDRGAGQRVYFNGIDGSNGALLCPSRTGEDRGARRSDPPARPPPVNFRLPFDTDEDDIGRAGWGVVFAEDTPDDVRRALQPLVDLRARTVRPGRLKVLTYQKGEQVRGWLARNGVSTANIDPRRVPYYLLLAGPPASIPFDFQYLLAVEYLVGRISFPRAEGYAAYAASIVDHETGSGPSGRKEIVFWGTAHDQETQVSADYLLGPLAGGRDEEGETLSEQLGFRAQVYRGPEATKVKLVEILRNAPAVLFTASHGVAFPSGHERQLDAQGALVCQEVAAAEPGQELDPGVYLSAADVPDDARVHGLVALHFACFGAGTPQADDSGRELADPPFVSLLPQRLLAHPGGGALAVIGHVAAALSYSFQPVDGDDHASQIQAFRDALGHVMAGRTVGRAVRGFSERYAILGADLLAEVGPLGDAPSPGEDSEDANRAKRRRVARWQERDDAQDYVLLGDPAVRLRVDRLT